MEDNKGWVKLHEVAKSAGITNQKIYLRIHAIAPEFKIPYKKIGGTIYIPESIGNDIILNGLPDIPKNINLRKPSKINIYNHHIGIIANNTGNEFYFDLDMYDTLNGWAWFENEQKYLRAEIRFPDGNKMILAHNIIAGTPINKNIKIDHKDRNTRNNLRNNLRVIPTALNTMNSPKRKNNQSGYKGVCPHKVVHVNGEIVIRWRAKIRKDNHDHSLGLYDDPRDAARAYDKAARSLFGEFALTNQQQGLLD